MKTYAISLFTVLGALALSMTARAEIPLGSFAGNLLNANGKKGVPFEAWIQSVQEPGGGATTYALLLGDYGKNQSAGGLYRVEDLQNGTQMWTELVQSADGTLQLGQDSAYTGTIVAGGIRLVPTAYGQALGQGCGLDIQLNPSGGSSWVAVQGTGKTISGTGKSTGTLSTGTFTGRLALQPNMVDGTFVVDPLFNGVSLMYAVSSSESSTTGQVTSAQFSTAVAEIARKGVFSTTNQFVFIQPTAGTELCLYPALSLK
jgi:hypothetical protein